MAITITEYKQIGPDLWRIQWTSGLGLPVFAAWYRGEQLLIDDNKVEFQAKDGEIPVVEITDDGAEVVQQRFSGRIELQWYDRAATTYEIQRHDGASFVVVDRRANSGSGYYRWTSPWHDDLSSQRYRVAGLDAIGNATPATDVTVVLVRPPAPPRLNYSLNVGPGTVDITAAS